MATLEELHEKAAADEAEAQAWAKAQGEPGGVAAFLAERGCDATPEQVEGFLRARPMPEGKLADEELGSVAGGSGAGTKSVTCPICGDSYDPTRVYAHACTVTCRNCGKLFAYNPSLRPKCPNCSTLHIP